MTTYGDDVLGRARVTDNADLRAYYDKLARLDAGALWTVANRIEPWFPQPESVPVKWGYRELRPLVLEALRLVSGDDAGRRVVALYNPRRRDIAATVGLLYSGLQVMGPGESMTAHRHRAAALRFVLEGTGAWTVVDGQKLRVGPRDFAITPNWTWHEHGNEGDDGPVIWQDGLDIPLVNALDAGFYEVHPDLRQEQEGITNSSLHVYGAGQLRPFGDPWRRNHSPLLAYPWEPTYEALLNAAKATDGSPYDGVIMEYSNPLTGGSVMPTMSAHMQLLRPGEATLAHRQVGSKIYTAAKGSGHSVVAGARVDWTEGDIFCVPSWAWHEHANASRSDDACLFSFNDFPVMRALGFFREEAYPDHGGHQPVA
ncbi:cupin domain-containing protein [Saccharothrix algeriensis]|uniref:Cupin domain-containing protein n=1 Tax=Saccharothrix algeriensis TaxID=173560 RepID=A0A8T8HZ36_9PSEU|nr:cupin domain-containing protein [Saccharothrix algeriensis]MBM7809302.1 gentisate 1,2-dioxygenase [Saccharothrix algeriensis]QTR03647.1 cupin domain-containing protein [Saccharothrix algeriensis]